MKHVASNIGATINLIEQNWPDPEPLDRGPILRNMRRWQRQLEVASKAEAGAHCATCTCHPGMTPAVRFDASAAEKDGAIRAHLIRMGWTPPGAKPKVLFTAEEVREAWACLRRHNHSIPDECLDQMRDVMLAAATQESRNG